MVKPSISVYIGSIINAICLLIVMKNLLKVKKCNLCNLILSIILLGSYIFISYIITNSFIRMILLFLVIIFCGYITFKNMKIKLQNIILYSFLEFIALLLAEILLSIVLSIIWEPLSNKNLEQVLGKFTINICVIYIFLLIMYIFILFRNFKYKCFSIDVLKNKFLILYTLLSVTLFCIIFYASFNAENRSLIFIVNLIAIILYSIIIFCLMDVKNKNVKIQTEYEVIAKNLSEYEILLDRQRILNHENKNQLLVIKGMINKNENAIDYIDALVDNQYKDNELLIMKTNRIPSGGLKGLIYYKMLNMKDKKINISLDVNRNINDIDFSKISVSTNQELCKIVGVFLDNAMQEVENLKEKNISIIIENIDNNLIIKISNNYSNKDIHKIGEKGYTTKGNGHGYGLRLVKNIIEGNKKFEQISQINGKIFSQVIKLKIKD